MNAADAEALLRRLIQPDIAPTLTDPEVASLLAEAAVVDADGYSPAEDEWTATYRRRGVYGSAVAGIDLKVAKIAVSHIHVAAEGVSVAQENALTHLKDLRVEYQRRAGGTIGGGVTWATAASAVVNWNDPLGLTEGSLSEVPGW